MNSRKVLAILGLSIWTMTAGSSVGHANEDVEALRLELQAIKNDYQMKLAELQSQIDLLAKQNDTQIKNLGDQMSQSKGIQADYVGRYNGPFQKGGLVFKDSSGFGNVSVGGYMDHEFENFENTNSTFDQHRWIINIGAELHERLRFYSEYEIEHGGPDAPGGGEAKVEQAYLEYLIAEAINIRGGAVLAPFGRTNIYHDSDLRDLTDRSIVARDIIPTTWTEAGVGLFGSFYPEVGDSSWEIKYDAYVVNGLDDGFSDTGLGGARNSLETDNNNNKAFVGRIVVSPALGHELGFSGYHGKYNTDNDDITGFGFDWLTTWGDFEFTGEYAFFDVDEPAGMDVANRFEGVNAELHYHFWPEFLNNTYMGQGFENPKLTLVGAYSWGQIDDDSDAGFGDNEEERYTLGLNYRPVENFVFKVEYQWNDTQNETLERGNNNGFISSAAMGF